MRVLRIVSPLLLRYWVKYEFHDSILNNILFDTRELGNKKGSGEFDES